jgi:DNA-binding transcriptional MerR regulator
METGQAIATRTIRLTSGQVCEATNLSRGALRLYEREGLIAPPPRSEGGYRLYPEETVDLVEAIKLVKSLGFGLAEIREFLSLLGVGGAAERELRLLAKRRIAAIDARIEGLKELREGLQAFVNGEDFADDEECAAVARLLRRRRAARPRRSDP